jgi:hypothetical protein
MNCAGCTLRPSRRPSSSGGVVEVEQPLERRRLS